MPATANNAKLWEPGHEPSTTAKARASQLGGPVLRVPAPRPQLETPADRGWDPHVDPDLAKPFIKWAGGKRKLLPHILAKVPPSFHAYHEPFVGGGALFYHLRPSLAFLSDANERLVRTYRAVRDDVGAVIRTLRRYPHDETFFLRLRSSDIDSATDADVAAWFIYLNKTGYNGLYRVNGRNRFNVPFGRQNNPTICDENTLRACSLRLRHAQVTLDDFTMTLQRAAPGDFVYFDPPYVPLSASSSFASYTKGGFGLEDHRRLRDVAVELKRRGVKVVISNSSHPIVRTLYADHFTIDEILAARAINSKADGRGPVRELLIH